jgi:hypothetical protein
MRVYALVDPRTDVPYYVGATTAPLGHRLYQHVGDARRGLDDARCDRTRELIALDLEPEIVELETCATRPSLLLAERRWIARLDAEVGLTNRATLRGMPVEERLLRSDALRGRVATPLAYTPEAVERRASQLRGRPGPRHSSATKKLISRQQRGRTHSPDHVAAQRLALLARSNSVRCSCGRVSSPGGIKQHQRATGCVGEVIVGG